MIWPQGLSIFYPYPLNPPLWQTFGAGLLLLIVTAFVIRNLRTYPYLVVGWFWYVGTLVPVIGLVQVGMQAMADRYMYVPLIGIFIMIAWGIPDLLRNLLGRKVVLFVLSGVVLCLLMVCSFLQVQQWQNSVHLFRHAISVTSGNYIAYNLLGNALRDRGQFDEAITNYRQAIRVNPEFWPSYNNSGTALAAQGKYDNAIRSYSSAIALSRKASDMSRDVAWIRINLGGALLHVGRIDEAASQFREATRLNPEVAVFHNSLGIALIRQKKYGESIKAFRLALQLDPLHAGAHYNLAMVLTRQGNLREAVVHFSEALRIQPDFGEARRNLEKALMKMDELQMKDN